MLFCSISVLQKTHFIVNNGNRNNAPTTFKYVTVEQTSLRATEVTTEVVNQQYFHIHDQLGVLLLTFS